MPNPLKSNAAGPLATLMATAVPLIPLHEAPFHNQATPFSRPRHRSTFAFRQTRIDIFPNKW